MNNEPVAIRYDFDGYGYQYMDSGSGSDWQTRVEGELLYANPVKERTDETELLETEIFVKDAIIKCYKEALEQIATGEIAGESNNYKDTVYVMRQIASDALAILRKAQEK